MDIDAQRIVFNSGASEGYHEVFAHLAANLPTGCRVGVSPTEHASLLAAAEYFFPGRVVLLALDSAGRVDRCALRQQLIAGELSAVSVMAANNETISSILGSRLQKTVKNWAISIIVMPRQWVGKMPLAGLGDCDFVTVSAHKFGGPGSGFLILPRKKPCFYTRGQQEWTTCRH